MQGQGAEPRSHATSPLEWSNQVTEAHASRSTRSLVAILDDYQHAALTSADWTHVHHKAEVVIFDQHIGDEEALADALAGFDVVVAMRERTPFPRSLFDRLPDLKLLVTTAPVNAAIDLVAAGERGVTVCGTGAWFYGAVEQTWALILACAKHIATSDGDVRAGRWQTSVSTDLAEARLGIVGLGNYGALVAGVGKAFGMDVIAWSPNLNDERCEQVGVSRVSREELFGTSDFVTIHMKLSERSHHLVDASALRLMRPTSYLINTSRGAIIDEPALVRALSENRIAGAGLDVFEREPLPIDHPLLSLRNVVLAPHMGYVTRRTYDVFYADIVAEIMAYLDGMPPNRLLIG